MSKAKGLKLKNKIISKFQTHKTDTGSTNVQIAILSDRINYLSDHLKTHKKDNHSRRGLLNLVSKRRKLISYLKKENHDEYVNISKKLKLKITT